MTVNLVCCLSLLAVDIKAEDFPLKAQRLCLQLIVLASLGRVGTTTLYQYGTSTNTSDTRAVT